MLCPTVASQGVQRGGGAYSCQSSVQIRKGTQYVSFFFRRWPSSYGRGLFLPVVSSNPGGCLVCIFFFSVLFDDVETRDHSRSWELAGEVSWEWWWWWSLCEYSGLLSGCYSPRRDGDAFLAETNLIPPTSSLSLNSINSTVSVPSTDIFDETSNSLVAHTSSP